MQKKTRETLAGYAFLSPALIIFLVLMIIPFIMSIYLAFTRWNFLSGLKGIKWVGLDNFTKLITRDRSFKVALKNTFIYTITIVPLSVFIGLVLAYYFHKLVFFKRYFRFVFFIPYISNMVALGAIFKFLFRVDGIINYILLNWFQISKSNLPNWLSTGAVSRVPIIALMIYVGIGFCMLIYIAALQDIPHELYEASLIDGASNFTQFWSITFPLISPTTFFLLVVRMINTFQIFAAINIITTTGKSGSAVSMVILIYEEAFKSYNFGYASAEAWVLVVVILIVTLFQMWGQRKWVNYT